MVTENTSLTATEHLKLVGVVASSAAERRSAFAIASQLVMRSDNATKDLKDILLDASTSIRGTDKRREFVNRMIAKMNKQLGQINTYATREAPKQVSGLGRADFNQNEIQHLVPSLLHLCKPGALKLALLMAYRFGFGKPAFGALMMSTTRDLRPDGAFHMPCSYQDTNNEYIIWPEEPLAKEVAASLQQTPSFRSRDELNKHLSSQLKTLTTQFKARLPIHRNDRSKFAKLVNHAAVFADLDLSHLTFSRLYEAARCSGIALNLPGFLRDMLNQTVLPACPERLSIFSITVKPRPQSPNTELLAPKKAVSELIDAAACDHQNQQRLDYILENQYIDETIWATWRVLSRQWVKSLINQWAEASKIGESKQKINSARKITAQHFDREDSYFGPNSWLFWCVNFLLDNYCSKDWSVKTLVQYRSILLCPELQACPSALDVREFDQEDLENLINELIAKESAQSTLNKKISLVVRMIRFAQEHEPDSAFPEISIPGNNGNYLPNRRSHILTPGELEDLINTQYKNGRTRNAVVLALTGFCGMRPVEVMYLEKHRLTLLLKSIEINIKRSKTPAGKRCLPVRNLGPQSALKLLMHELAKLAQKRSGPHLFFDTDLPKNERRKQLIEPAMQALRSQFGDGIDLYTLRHSFASWSFLRLVMAMHPAPNLLSRSPNLQHEIFTKGLEPFAELVFHHGPRTQDPYSFYRLCGLMGHATPDTLPKTYIHTAGFAHSMYLGVLEAKC